MYKTFTFSEGDYSIDDNEEIEVEISLSDIFSEIDDDELIEEINDRNLSTEIETIVNEKQEYDNPEKLKRLLCDILKTNYHVKMDNLIQLFINKLDDTFLDRYSNGDILLCHKA